MVYDSNMRLVDLLPFLPADVQVSGVAKCGFRLGATGTHTSRTLMVDDLVTLLTAVPSGATRAVYQDAIIVGNVLAKSTAATRRLTSQRLGELYALDTGCPLFRVLRRLWDVDPRCRPLLALLAGLARDPLLRATAPAIIDLAEGGDLPRQALAEPLRAAVGERLNDAVLDKVVRNASSSWVQSGHLIGRTFKRRRRVHASPAAVAFALWLADAAGWRDDARWRSGWIAALDCGPSEARSLAVEAKRLDLIDLRIAGAVTELDLGRLDPAWRGG
jgi:hypothetical protein